MRSKAKSKTVRKIRAKIRVRATAHKRSGPKKPRNAHLGSGGSITSPEMTNAPAVKKCEELEVGDIGNFGSPDELEDHEKRCSEPATQFCHTCGRNLCANHYELLHRDHDGAAGNLPGSQVL